MTSPTHGLLERIEALRIPPQPRSVESDWKDWYHFVLLHIESGARAIVNVNVAGGGALAQLQVTLVVHLPGTPPRLHGFSRAQPWLAGMVSAAPLRIHSDEVGLGFEQQRFDLRVTPRGFDLGLVLRVEPLAEPLLVTEGAPFGSGFIGWGLVPRLQARGKLHVGAETITVDDGWACYQDHNFGRFRWGDDFGWEWMVAQARTEGGQPLAVIVDLRTDRSHRRGGLPYLFVVVGERLRKVFLGPAVTIRWRWSADAVLPPRLPGPMATLLADRTTREPTSVQVQAADERDRIELTLAVDAYLEVVPADNRGAGITRIGETSGAVHIVLQLGGQRFEARGLAYAEYTQ